MLSIEAQDPIEEELKGDEKREAEELKAASLWISGLEHSPKRLRSTKLLIYQQLHSLSGSDTPRHFVSGL